MRMLYFHCVAAFLQCFCGSYILKYPNGKSRIRLGRNWRGHAGLLPQVLEESPVPYGAVWKRGGRIRFAGPFNEFAEQKIRNLVLAEGLR